MAEGNLPKSGGFGAVVGATVLLVALLVAVITEGWSEEQDGSFAANLISVILVGAVVGWAVGAAYNAINSRRSAAPPVNIADPWAAPVDRCEEAARTVADLLGTLPDSAAADWLADIAGTMADKLAEIEAFADAGRAVTGRRGVTQAKRHPLYAQLERSADEFAEVANHVSSLMVELHAPGDLERVRTELQVLTEQLPLLRQAN